jgi:catechol 2,3-dioxygenase-like lactoylglutathione lyase family enzyme
MLTDGFNHVAVLTSNTDRLHAFYTELFDAVVGFDDKLPDLRLSFVHIGPRPAGSPPLCSCTSRRATWLRPRRWWMRTATSCPSR